MNIYPAIDLIDGKVVRLSKGSFLDKTIYNNDPLEVANNFARMGCQYLHVVDLDGARTGRPQQTRLIQQISRSCGLQVQAGGGIRTPQHVAELLEAGADRVVIGSLAASDRPATKGLLSRFGGTRLTLALDVAIDDAGIPLIALKGWQEISQLTLHQLVDEYLDQGLRQVLCTDISRDGTLSHPNFTLYKNLSRQFPQISFLASGGVASLQHIRTLKADRVGGVIVGRALYERTLNLKEALEC